MARPASPSTRLVDLPAFSVRAAITPASVDDDARTVDLVFSTGAPVERFDWWTGKRYIEKLSMDPKSVRLERLNAGAPLLDTHGSWSVRDQLGAVVPETAVIVGKQGRARVQFSRRDEVEGVWQDVREGLVRNVSVGYRVHKFEEEQGSDNKLPVRTAVDWEPFEISMVPMPADAKAQTRGQPPGDLYPCEIVGRHLDTRAMDGGMDPNMPKVGDRIRVIRPHMPEHDNAEGVVRQAVGHALGVEFDDQTGEIHQWYLPTEVIVTEAAAMVMDDEGRASARRVSSRAVTDDDRRRAFLWAANSRPVVR